MVFKRNKNQPHLKNISYFLKKIKIIYKFIFEIIIDLINFRKQTKKFRNSNSRKNNGKSIFIIHSDFYLIYELKLLGYLVQGLRRE